MAVRSRSGTRHTGSKTQGNTAEGPPRRPGEIDPAKGHFRSRLPTPRPSGSYAAGKSVRPAKAKSVGFRSETSTAFSSARGEDLPDMRVSAGGPAGAEILDTLETGTMANTNTIICMLQSLFCNKNGKYLGEPRKRGSKIGADRRAFQASLSLGESSMECRLTLSISPAEDWITPTY